MMVYEEFGFIGNPFPPFGTQKIGRIKDRIVKVKPIGIDEELKYVKNWLTNQIQGRIEKPEFLWIVGHFGFGKSTLLQCIRDSIEEGEFGNIGVIYKDLTALPPIEDLIEETYEEYRDKDRIVVIIEEGQENIRDLTGSRKDDVNRFTRSLRSFADFVDDRVTKYSIILAITPDSEVELHKRFDISMRFLRNRIELKIFDLFMAEEIVKQLLRNVVNEKGEEKLKENPFYPFDRNIFPLVYVLVPYVEKKLRKSTVGPNARTFNHIMSELFEIAVRERSEITLDFLKQLLKERRLRIGGEPIDIPAEDKLKEMNIVIKNIDPYIMDIVDYIVFSPWWKSVEEIEYGTSKKGEEVSAALSRMQSFGFLEARKGVCIKEENFNSLKESLVKEFDYYGDIIERLSTDKTISYRISKNGECCRVIFLTPTIPREIVERLEENGETVNLYRLGEDWMYSLYRWEEEKKIPSEFEEVWNAYLQKTNMEKRKFVMEKIENLLNRSGFFSKIKRINDHLSSHYNPLPDTDLDYRIAIYRFLSLGEETLEQKIEKIIEDLNADVSDRDFAILFVNPPYRKELPFKKGDMIRGMPGSSRIYIVDITDEKLAFLLAESKEGMEFIEEEVRKAQRTFIKSAIENYALIPVFGVDIGRENRKEFLKILSDNWWYRAYKWLTKVLSRQESPISDIQISDHYDNEWEFLNKTEEYTDEENLFIKDKEVLVSPYERKVLELVKNTSLKKDQLETILRNYFVAGVSKLPPEYIIDLLTDKHLFGNEEERISVIMPSDLVLSIENKLGECERELNNIKREHLEFFKEHFEITNEKWLERFKAVIRVKKSDFAILREEEQRINEDDWENIGIFNTALSIFENEVDTLLEDINTAQTKFEKQLEVIKAHLDDFTTKGGEKAKNLEEVTNLKLLDIKGLKDVADGFTDALKELCEFINSGATSKEEVFDREFNKLREASDKILDTIDRVIAIYQEGEEAIREYRSSLDEFEHFKEALSRFESLEVGFIETLPRCENDVKQIYNLFRDIKQYPHLRIPVFEVEKERIRGLLQFCSLNAAVFHLESLKKFKDDFNPLKKREEFEGSIENLRGRIKIIKDWFERKREKSDFTLGILSNLTEILEKENAELYVSYVNYMKSAKKRNSLFLCHHLAIEDYQSFAVDEKINEFSQILNISPEDVKDVLEDLEGAKILRRGYEC